MKRRTLAALAALGLVATTAGACSGTTKPAGGLMLSFASDMSIPKDVDTLRIEITQNGVTRFAQEYGIGPSPAQTIPATLMVLPPSEAPSDPVQVRLIALQNGNPRILRDAITVVPADRVAELKMPFAWLCDGSAKKDGQTASGDTRYAPATCATGTTCVAGSCVSARRDPATLPGFDPGTIFGGGTGPGGGACFDTIACFSTATVAPVDRAACTIPAPAQSAGFNVAIVVGAGHDGICGAEACLVPLDGNSDEGWRASGGVVQLPVEVCARLQSGAAAAVVTSTGCATKTDATPTCGPWSSTGGGSGDAGQTIDLGGAGDAAASDSGEDAGEDSSEDATVTDGDATVTDGDATVATDAPDDVDATSEADAPELDAAEAGAADAADAAVDVDASDGAPPAALVRPLDTDSGAPNAIVGFGGVSSDGYVEVQTTSGQQTIHYFAAPLDGGSLVPLGTSNGGIIGVTWSLHTALEWPQDPGDGGFGLAIWTPAHNVVDLSKSPGNYVYDHPFSADGTRVAFPDNATATTADLVVAALDGSGRTILSPGMSGGFVNFHGNNLFAVYGAGDGGSAGDAGSSTITVFPGGSATGKLDIGPVLDGANVDVAGDKVVATLATNELAAYAVPGGAKTSIDTSVSNAAISDDGTMAAYVTTAGALRFASTTSPAPVTVISSGVAAVIAISPDDKTIAYTTMSNGNLTDLRLAAAVANATPLTVESTATALVGLYDDVPVFTPDSSHVLFLTGDTNGTSGTLNAAPVATGVPTALGLVEMNWFGQTNDWFAYDAPTGAIVVFAENGTLAIEDLANGAKRTFALGGPFTITPDSSRSSSRGSTPSTASTRSRSPRCPESSRRTGRHRRAKTGLCRSKALGRGANARLWISTDDVRAAKTRHRPAMVGLRRVKAGHRIPKEDHRSAKARLRRATADHGAAKADHRLAKADHRFAMAVTPCAMLDDARNLAS